MPYTYRPALYFALVFFVFDVLLIKPGRSQHANERDIQLPGPENSQLSSLYLIGDSTVRNGNGDGENGQWGWGSFLASYFDTSKINIVNRAIGGRSSRTYITQGYWDQLLTMLKPNDIVMIQFGHNDGGAMNDTSRARGVLNGIGVEEKRIYNLLTGEDEIVYTYGSYLRTYISDIRAKGATPIVCSLVPRNRWEHGTVVENENNFAKWAHEVAKSEQTSFIDLNEIVSCRYNAMGPGNVEDLFSDDGTHTNRAGAELTAQMVIAGLKSLEDNTLQSYFSEKASNIEFAYQHYEPDGNLDSTESLYKPVVAGYGKGVFNIGKLIYSDPLENSDDWVMQIEQSDAEVKPHIHFGNGSLNVLVPGRGATIWNRNKFSGPIAITYKVKVPTTYVRDLGIVARDVNSFWNASDPDIPDHIFNHDTYTGAFYSYHKQQGYYASMGGRDNTTTRFRRYPRVKDGKKVTHLALSDKDGREGYLIQSNKTHTIQLVAYNDVVQFIVDRKVFYEIREGDSVRVSHADETHKKVEYTEEQFPPYNEGWFGFRLVNTHHIYSDFRVYRLEPAD